MCDDLLASVCLCDLCRNNVHRWQMRLRPTLQMINLMKRRRRKRKSKEEEEEEEDDDEQ